MFEKIAKHVDDDIHRWYRLLSVQVHALAASYLAIYAIMPTLDPSVAKLLPTPYQASAFGIYILLSVIARFVAQQPVPPSGN